MQLTSELYSTRHPWTRHRTRILGRVLALPIVIEIVWGLLTREFCSLVLDVSLLLKVVVFNFIEHLLLYHGVDRVDTVSCYGSSHGMVRDGKLEVLLIVVLMLFDWLLSFIANQFKNIFIRNITFN